MPTWGLTHHTMPSHPSFAQVAHAQRTSGTADNPTKALTGAGIKADSERQEGRALRHIPCSCCSAELERQQAELSQHPSEGKRRRGLLQLFLLPSTLSKQDQDRFGKERREH